MPRLYFKKVIFSIALVLLCFLLFAGNEKRLKQNKYDVQQKLGFGQNKVIEHLGDDEEKPLLFHPLLRQNEAWNEFKQQHLQSDADGDLQNADAIAQHADRSKDHADLIKQNAHFIGDQADRAIKTADPDLRQDVVGHQDRFRAAGDGKDGVEVKFQDGEDEIDDGDEEEYEDGVNEDAEVNENGIDGDEDHIDNEINENAEENENGLNDDAAENLDGENEDGINNNIKNENGMNVDAKENKNGINDDTEENEVSNNDIEAENVEAQDVDKKEQNDDKEAKNNNEEDNDKEEQNNDKEEQNNDKEEQNNDKEVKNEDKKAKNEDDQNDDGEEEKNEQVQVEAPDEHADQGPGEMNKPVIINKEKLSADERKKYDEGYKNNSYNQYASDMISLHRKIPDPRHELCKQIDYPHDLPTTSVIIIFHNEGWSALLRTVHSVLDQSPEHILKEVILVDDFSDKEHLKTPLDKYVLDFPKVQIVRSPQRDGLIYARMLGAKVATGEFLVFLDSHCEAMEGWLEPLAYRIYQNWTNVVTPQIDGINMDTFQIYINSIDPPQIGGFDWGLIFGWHPFPSNRIHRQSIIEPAPSPTMAGGLFGISKKFFEHLGMYDPGMFIWGGENLELSFKVWMCGGQLHQIPCSHVGHVFRKTSPYSWSNHPHGKNPLLNNLVRLAEVWLDDYKEIYYEKIGHQLGDYGNVSDRVALRERLQCKSFKWYLDTIYLELFVPRDSLATGEIRNKGGPKCVDADTKTAKSPIMYQCHGEGGNQVWYLTAGGEIRRDSKCLDFNSGASSKIMIQTCHGKFGHQKWEYTQWGGIVHPVSGTCMEWILIDTLAMRDCQPDNPRQQWLWKRQEKKDT